MYSILEAVELVTRCDLKFDSKGEGVSSLDVTQPNQQKVASLCKGGFTDLNAGAKFRSGKV